MWKETFPYGLWAQSVAKTIFDHLNNKLNMVAPMKHGVNYANILNKSNLPVMMIA